MNTTDTVLASGVPSLEAPEGGRLFGGARSHVARGQLVVLLFAVNLVAVGGQAAWFHDHVTGPGRLAWAPAIGIALVVEMIGVYLASMAHAARMADQYAGFLQAGAYGIGLLAGTLNFWHYAPDWKVTAQAITFGALSAISPWLWSIYSRHVNRARLAEIKRAPSRRFWHPVRFMKVTSFAAWQGIADVDEAVMRWELEQTTRADDPRPVSPGTAPATRWAQIEQLRTERPGITQAEAARQLGCSERTIRNAIPAGVRW
jgi:hypothetical protein